MSISKILNEFPKVKKAIYAVAWAIVLGITACVLLAIAIFIKTLLLLLLA
jgi:hypothetical protein